MAERAQVIPAERLRITAQFRVRGGMAYELLQHGKRMTLLFTSSEDSSWSCEAFIGIRENTGSVMRVGKTRAEALKLTSAELADSTRFDWQAIVEALTQVRAL